MIVLAPHDSQIHTRASGLPLSSVVIDSTFLRIRRVQNHFIAAQSLRFRDPQHPLFVNSCGIEEHGQLGARELLVRKNIEMDVLNNRHWLPTP